MFKKLILKYKAWRFRKKVRFALHLLSTLEDLMKEANIPRQQRRFLWRSLANDEDRTKAIDYLGKACKVK
jgi:uncharacterized protein (UPF0147 family)